MTPTPTKAGLVERLREESGDLQRNAWARQDGGLDCSLSAMLADEAAAEIERSEKHRNDLADKIVNQSVEIGALKAEIESLRTALERIALSGDGEDVFERSTLYGTFQNIARQALKEHPRNAD